MFKDYLISILGTINMLQWLYRTFCFVHLVNRWCPAFCILLFRNLPRQIFQWSLCGEGTISGKQHKIFARKSQFSSTFPSHSMSKFRCTNNLPDWICKVRCRSIHSLQETWGPYSLVLNFQPLLGSSFLSLSSIAMLL